MWFFQNPEIIFYHFFRIFNLDILWVLILQKRIGSRYLVPLTPTTVLSRSFWNFTGALKMVWRYACVFFRILKLSFITGFLLQYLGKWYRTNGPLDNLPIFMPRHQESGGVLCYTLWNFECPSISVPTIRVPATPPTVSGQSFSNFTGAFRMVWRYAYCFFRILKLFFITFFSFLT